MSNFHLLEVVGSVSEISRDITSSGWNFKFYNLALRGLIKMTICATKGPVTHTCTITHFHRTKNEQFWSVRCDSLGVRHNSLMIWRERRINVIHLLCASTYAHIFCMFKNWAFIHVWIWTPEERQTNASLTLGTSRAHALNSLCFRWPRFVPVTCKRRTVHT